jgi:hypothetical protein
MIVTSGACLINYFEKKKSSIFNLYILLILPLQALLRKGRHVLNNTLILLQLMLYYIPLTFHFPIFVIVKYVP